MPRWELLHSRSLLLRCVVETVDSIRRPFHIRKGLSPDKILPPCPSFLLSSISLLYINITDYL